LFNQNLSNETINYYNSYLITVADQASEREQESVEAEREVLDMKMAEYMESHVGETYIGVVSTVTKFGMFVELPNLVEGLVHVSTLNGFYVYVPELLSLVERNSKKTYRIGDSVKWSNRF
jgi:ribonuclease R